MLGELATQAMPLYSLLVFPNLKNEMPELSDRFKHITKLWRKLDAPTKLVYVNKSRQNRYKKKSDEKVSLAGANAKIKRTKSPNSDKQSDAEFSRSATPLVAPDNIEQSVILNQHESQNTVQLNEKLRQSINNISGAHVSGAMSPQVMATASNQFNPQMNLVKPESLNNKQNAKTEDHDCKNNQNQKNLMVNLNNNNNSNNNNPNHQPPKIIQLSNNNQIPVGFVTNNNNNNNSVQANANPNNKNPVLLYQIDKRQQQQGQIQQQQIPMQIQGMTEVNQNSNMPQLKLVESLRTQQTGKKRNSNIVNVLKLTV